MTRHPVRLSSLVTLAVGAVTASLITIGPASGAVASADTSTSASAAARLADGTPVTTRATADKVDKFWTKDRMRHAIELSGAPSSDARGAPALRRTGKAGTYPSAKAVQSAVRQLARGDAVAAAAIAESATVGKVFFTKPSDGKNYACSASALNSASKQLVITAGHCVHEGNGDANAWMTNWTFVPRYRDGNRPFGTFSAKQFRAFDAWRLSGDRRRDVGLTTTFPLNGRKLVDVVGGMGLAWNFPEAVSITAFGYPSNFNSEVQRVCSGTTAHSADFIIQIGCNFGPGASGGPWLLNFDSATGRGNVNGVFSTNNSSGINKSSYFDDAVKAMVDAQGGVT